METLKKIWAISLMINGIGTILMSLHYIFGPFLTDLAVRILAVVMILAAAVIVFTSVRIAIKKKEE